MLSILEINALSRRFQRRQNRFCSRLAGLAMVTALVISACAPVADVKPPPTEVRLFRSQDYIVYKLRENDTPRLLADKFLGNPDKDWMIAEANDNIPFERDKLVVIPLRKKNRGGLTDLGFQGVPILCYHQFAETDCTSPLCMPAPIFDRQMRYLKENGYRVITPQDLSDFLNYRQAIPPKAVLISIDDGYRSVYDIAYPILKKYGFTATLFIYTDYVGVSKKAITWDQLRELKANGFTIGSHTVAHSDLSRRKKDETPKAYRRRLQRELVVSKQLLDKQLAQDTIFFSFPYGRYNQQAVDLAQAAGYTLAVSVERGSNPFFANPYTLKRDQILKRDMHTFISRLKTFNRYQ